MSAGDWSHFQPEDDDGDEDDQHQSAIKKTSSFEFVFGSRGMSLD